VRVPTGAPTRAAAPHPTNPAADQWVAIGPAVAVRGSGTGPPRVAGRVVALAVSADGTRVYAGTALGGVWFSGDAGAHWTSLDFYSSVKDGANVLQHADALSVGAIGVKFGATAADDVVYVGAGEHPALGVETPPGTLAAVGIRRAVGPAVAVSPVAVAIVGAAAADPWCVEATELPGVAVNRFAMDRVDGIVWSATSRGLYRRVVNPALAWTRIDTGLGDGETSDVVVVPGIGAELQRIYVAALGGRVAWSVDDGAHWQIIDPPAFPAIPAATAIVRVQLAGGNVPGHAVVFAVADGPRLWRIDGNAALAVSGLPAEIVREDPETLKPFALAIAVHPANDAAHQNVIAVGGQTFRFPTADRRQAALFTGQLVLVGGAWTFPRAAVVAPAPPAEWIGSGMPPGVQTLAWVPAGGPTHLWVGSDGGVFRSTNNGAFGTFVERNTGLGAFDVTTFAQARDADAVMLAGTRSNGLLRRASGETWEVLLHGPIGGVAIDPADARRMYVQVSRSTWRHTKDGGATAFAELAFMSPTPVALAPADKKLWDDKKADEAKRSALVSRMGLFAQPGSRRGTQRALGTDRVWYMDDERQFAARGVLSGWVTLPSLTDPYDPVAVGAPNRDKDKLEGPVRALQWGAEDRLYVLTEKSIYFFERNADLIWKAPDPIYDGPALENANKIKERGQIPHVLPRLSLAVHRASAGKGNLYVGTSGAADKHHCWWYDGDGKWLDTGFAIDTPVRAIVVDPDHPEVVFLGTDRGVYKGTGQNFAVDGNGRPAAGGNPNWNWALYSDGLSGAPCTDLAIYAPTDSPRRLLRAALAGRGIWEVLLDGVQQVAEIYLRSHAYDARRLEVPRGGARDPLGETGRQVALDASPDIRVWRAPGAAPPEAAVYPVAAGSHRYEIWRLLAALRALGEDVDPERGWDPVGTPAAVARQRAALFPMAPPANDKALWDRILRDNPLPHDRTPPDPADLVAYMRDEPDRWPKGFRASCVSGDGTARISVTVHTRRWRPIANGTVSIALLRGPYSRRHSLEDTPDLPVGWGNQLFVDLATVPWGGVNPPWLGADWSYADPANPFRTVPVPFDPHNPQVVVFDVSLTAGGADTWNKPGWVLLAVVLVNGDALPATVNVAELVRTDRRVAARSVRRALLLAATTQRNAAMDMSGYPGNARINGVWSSSNIVLTGFYLSQIANAPGEGLGGQHIGAAPFVAPGFVSGEFIVPAAPVLPVSAAYRGHLSNSWMAHWPDITPDLGVLPIYFGHQDPHNVDPEGGAPNQHWRPKGPFDLRQEIARANAEDAEDKARVHANIPIGAVLYLDWEVDNLNWVLQDGGGNTVASARDYCVAFIRAIAGLGYRPGLYCRTAVSAILRGECPGVFIWNVRNANPPALIVQVLPKNGATQLVADTSVPLAESSPHTIARQWRLEFALPANPIFAVGTPIDVDCATVHDPAFPERRMLTAQIVGGQSTAVSIAAGECVIYTVRRGRPARASGPLNALVRDADADLVAADLKYQWNPFADIAAVRAPGPATDPDPTDVLLALAYAEAEGDEVWRLLALRHRVTAAAPAPWVLETLSDSGLAIDPLPGVAAVSRRDPSIDAFAVVNASVKFSAHGSVAVARRPKDRPVWSALTPIAGATARRTNRLAAVSRDVGIANVFWVDGGGRLTTSESLAANPSAFSAPVQIGDPAVQIHPFSPIVAVARNANRIDVLFLGRVPPAPVLGVAPPLAVWRLYNVFFDAGWAAGNSRIADDGTVTLESLSPIAACLRDATHLDVFTVGEDGALYVTTLDYNNVANPWSGPARIGAVPAGLARLRSVDSACSDGAGSVQVIATSRDGNLWATSCSPAAGYGALVSLAATLAL